VVGHGDGGHAEFLGFRGHLLGARHAIEEGVFGVEVEVDEGIGHGRRGSVTQGGAVGKRGVGRAH
jgi:hypothetical protein